ncbi:hypothetical protein HHK36_000157 [Tetracentron sinense]|uniref:Uncharacterized protein n=1 Tax=Tetracentron sinense TaxID=13715 RepID=A0A834ZRR2_TETSI|nr:hypothetical protein HHK36_000157 [Tetracentron sinense]
MGHHSCCNQQKVKRGLWSPEEDEKLVRYITTHGYGCWSEVPEKAGLIRKHSAPPPTVPLSVELAQQVYGSNQQLDVLNHEFTTRPSIQETLFSSPCPIFMFDTGVVDGMGDGNVRAEFFHDGTGINSDSWHLNQHQSFTTSVADSNYLPPLIENMENMVPMQVQSSSMDEDGEKTMECLQRQELSEWVESQLCPSFLIWEHVEGQLSGEGIAPVSSDMGAMLSSYPSSL